MGPTLRAVFGKRQCDRVEIRAPSRQYKDAIRDTSLHRFGQTNFCPGQKHAAERARMVQREHGIVTLLIRPHCSSPQADADLAERATRENFAQHMTRFLLERSFSGRRMHDPQPKAHHWIMPSFMRPASQSVSSTTACF
jgi:hypothetical protein